MSDIFNTTDPLISAAAAIRHGEDLAPILRHRLRELLPNHPLHGLPDLASRLAAKALFEPRTVAALRHLLDVVEMAASREVYPQSEWIPVRCIHGFEEFEEVTCWYRTPKGDALGEIGSRLRILIRHVAQTNALRKATELFSRDT